MEPNGEWGGCPEGTRCAFFDANPQKGTLGFGEKVELDADGKTPMHAAAHSGHTECLRLGLEQCGLELLRQVSTCPIATIHYVLSEPYAQHRECVSTCCLNCCAMLL